MATTDTSEKGLETLIFLAMTGRTGLEPVPDTFQEVSPTAAGGTGWLAGWTRDYDRTHALDTAQLFSFLQITQPEELKKLGIANYSNKSDITLLKFLSRLESEIGKRGVMDVLRNGIKHGALSFELLKNSLTKQTVEDAVEQYRRDRDPREKLFELGRCVTHFAVDEQEVMFCTQLKGKASWFLPFKQGWNDGAGNPPNPDGLKTGYLWKRILTPDGLTDILENYAQIIEAGKKIIISTVQKFPFILEEIGDEHRNRRFAIIIDEAHSSQGGRTAAAMSEALAKESDPEDAVNEALQRRMEARKMLTNASYFATMYIGDAGRDRLDPVLDACVANYLGQLDEYSQVDFKGKAKAFVRTYDFLASILPHLFAS